MHGIIGSANLSLKKILCFFFHISHCAGSLASSNFTYRFEPRNTKQKKKHENQTHVKDANLTNRNELHFLIGCQFKNNGGGGEKKKPTKRASIRDIRHKIDFFLVVFVFHFALSHFSIACHKLNGTILKP